MMGGMAENHADNPYLALSNPTDDRNEEDPRPRKPVVWTALATIAAVMGLCAAYSAGMLLIVIVMACFSDTSRWEMPPYAICVSLLIGGAPFLAIFLVCLAAMRRIRR
jgi:hypothetical protein